MLIEITQEFSTFTTRFSWNEWRRKQPLNSCEFCAWFLLIKFNFCCFFFLLSLGNLIKQKKKKKNEARQEWNVNLLCTRHCDHYPMPTIINYLGNCMCWWLVLLPAKAIRLNNLRVLIVCAKRVSNASVEWRTFAHTLSLCTVIHLNFFFFKNAMMMKRLVNSKFSV